MSPGEAVMGSQGVGGCRVFLSIGSPVGNFRLGG